MLLYVQGMGLLRAAKEDNSKGMCSEAEITGTRLENCDSRSDIIFSQAIFGDYCCCKLLEGTLISVHSYRENDSQSLTSLSLGSSLYAVYSIQFIVVQLQEYRKNELDQVWIYL